MTGKKGFKNVSSSSTQLHMVMYIADITSLLMLTGDVETNPGPVPGATDQPLIHMWTLNVHAEEKEQFRSVDAKYVYRELTKTFEHPGDDIFISREGNWIIKTTSDNDFSALTNIRISDKDYRITLRENTRSSTCRGQFYHASTRYYSKEEIEEELRRTNPTPSIMQVVKESKFMNKQLTETGNVIITFKSKIRPEKVKFQNLILTLEDHIPKPKRCTKCQQFRHLRRFCEGHVICAKCTGNHETADCTETTVRKCVNCQGEHWASSWNCPVYLKEEKIEEIRERERLTYRQAEYKLSKPKERQAETYSAAASSGFASAAKPAESILKSSNEEVQQLKSTVETLAMTVKQQQNILQVQSRLIWLMIKRSYMKVEGEVADCVRYLSSSFTGQESLFHQLDNNESDSNESMDDSDEAGDSGDDRKTRSTNQKRKERGSVADSVDNVE